MLSAAGNLGNEGSLTADNAQRSFLKFYGSRLLLGLISLLMVADLVLRGLNLAFEPAKTDFSDVYAGAWLWRHGQNFYDSALATRAHEQLVHASFQIAPVYPPTAFVLVSPFTFLPWGWANFIWLLLGLAGIPATLFLLLRLRGPAGWDLRTFDPRTFDPRTFDPRTWDLRTAALATLVLSFNPLHQAYHLGNSALLVVPLCLGVISLAEAGHDLSAGLILGTAAALKPQVAFWILVYYLFRRRAKVLFGAVIPVAALMAIFFRRAVVLSTVIASYRANLRFWFAPGRPDGFTEGARPYHVNMMQVVLYQIVHSVSAANLLAHALFVIGLVIWILIVWRARLHVPVSLAVSSLLALSFLSMYHSVSDVTFLTLALCWAVPVEGRPWTRARIWTCALFLVMTLPGHSALMRFSPHLGASVTTQWWWHLFVERYFVWLLLALNVVLLASLRNSAAEMREEAPV
jgi:hypothetical protein